MGKFDFIEDYILPNRKISNFGQRAPFGVKFLSWQLSNIGDYIEYVIEIQYLEGTGPKWVIYRRYSDFLALHDSLQEFFENLKKKDPKFQEPAAPPQIEKQSAPLLDMRKIQLEVYLKQLLYLGECPAELIGFIEFSEN